MLNAVYNTQYYRFWLLLTAFVLLIGGCGDEQLVNLNDDPSADNNEVLITKDISGVEIWQPTRGNYIIQKKILVHRGATLSIRPGTIVKFVRGAKLVVTGKLIVGHPLDQNEIEKPVLFTSNSIVPEPGAWEGIHFENTNNVESSIRGATIEYADVGIRAMSSSPAIMDCIFRLNEIGMLLENSESRVEYNNIDSNTIGMRTIKGSPKIEKNNITNNEEGVIYRAGHRSVLTKNNLNNNLLYAVRVQSLGKMSMPHNWWGSTSTTQIDLIIRDGNDGELMVDGMELVGIVVYQPIANEPIADVGARFFEN